MASVRRGRNTGAPHATPLAGPVQRARFRRAEPGVVSADDAPIRATRRGGGEARCDSTTREPKPTPSRRRSIDPVARNLHVGAGFIVTAFPIRLVAHRDPGREPVSIHTKRHERRRSARSDPPPPPSRIDATDPLARSAVASGCAHTQKSPGARSGRGQRNNHHLKRRSSAAVYATAASAGRQVRRYASNSRLTSGCWSASSTVAFR